jgi:nucleoside-diphosphate-sugar epimerase
MARIAAELHCPAVVGAVRRLVGGYAGVRFAPQAGLDDAQSRRRLRAEGFDNSRAREVLGYAPSVNLAAAICGAAEG